MKFIQLLGNIEGFGVTRYIIELKAALEMTGHDVEVIYFNNNLKSTNNTQNIPDLTIMDYGQELIDKLNSVDVVLIHTLINKKAHDEHKRNFYKLASEVTKPIKAIFCNDHNSTVAYPQYVSDITGDLEFVKNIDKFITFCPINPVFQKIYKVYPEIMSKYVQLELPYRFTNSSRVEFEKKYKRVAYIGRFSHLKDPMLLMRHREQFAENGYQLEMRGLDRSPAVAFTPGLVYEFHEDGTRTPALHTVEYISQKNIERDHPGKTAKDLVHLTDRDINKIYLFGRYKRDEGVEAASYSMFGCNFNHNRVPLRQRNNIEYAVAEIVDAGTIPLLNHKTMSYCRLYDENGKINNESALDYACGICVKQDGSNIDEVLTKMNELASNKEAYDKYRDECLAFFKRFYDPVRIAKRLVNDLTSNDNSEALAEYGF